VKSFFNTIGNFQTWQRVRYSVAIWGKADIGSTGQNRRE